MNGVDTNVLVRILIADDQIQTRKAVKLIENQISVFVSVIVLCEIIWVLQSRYGFNKSQLISALEKILKIIRFLIFPAIKPSIANTGLD
ncbi:MAG: hypothetical protein A3E82_06075 [Gammaproteobacteria bacterium RIFCSPHIGHO2_12_FULL_38_11]|nr:MAG: hypothetical protein A3E82_06075 [Gammaproteobacteria bacterium RIFCSPHIGHO2_12_FULL_38_11]